MKKSVEIKLDKVRNLRFGMGAFINIEDKLNKSISKINFEELSYKDISIFLWAGLQHEDLELSPEVIVNLIDEYSDIQTVIEAMGKAIELSTNSKKA